MQRRLADLVQGDVHFVIIGNGVAGMEAALTLRDQHTDAKISVVSEESDHFFSRTALMWVFTGQLSHRCIEPLERDAYERLRLERVRARAIGVDVAQRKLLLAKGATPIPYDRLIIACGSKPRSAPWPGSNLAGIGHFVTLQDLEWLEKELVGGPSLRGRPPRPDHHLERSEEASPYWPRPVGAEKRGSLGKQPAVVGGGLIGIEAIEVMVHRHLRPKFLIREEWFWPIAIEPREATWITERMSAHGIDVRLNYNIQNIIGRDGVITQLETDHGTLDVDTLVVAIGVVPNTDWLKGSEVMLDPRGAIPVNDRLETNVPGIFAAGDCAGVRWFDGAVRPEQLWYTSRDQGRIAARAALGQKVRYERPIWYNSAKLMDIEFTTAGLVNMKVEGEQNWYYEETGAVRSTTRVVVQEDRVIGFNLLGRRWDHSVLNRWIMERRTLAWVLEHLQEASFDTEFVPPLRIPDVAKQQLMGDAAPNPMIPGPSPFTFA
ncbi:MAG: FAD-dependent oxidoreductase [Myxococcales bacterium]|nr:FAD-dependent oxidoreductase [Myxococcales bacterium]